jgi:16S rRNA G966 N2-methylase RsmD
VRVIAGALKGRRLLTPRGATTRPTADQVRIALMDALGPWLPDARVLDLFAGAGGVGLEALSRGAAHATFVERDPRALAALVENIRTLDVESRTYVVRGDVARQLERLAGEGRRFEIIFLDPPYATDVGGRARAAPAPRAGGRRAQRAGWTRGRAAPDQAASGAGIRRAARLPRPAIRGDDLDFLSRRRVAYRRGQARRLSRHVRSSP